MRILMLSPHPTVKGPLPKHTPLLVTALKDLGCEVRSESWGRHSDVETRVAQVFGRLRDVWQVRNLLGQSEFDAVVVKTSHDWRALLRDVALLAATRRRCRRIVVQFHGSRTNLLQGRGHRLFKATSWILFQLADGVFVLSTQEAKEGRAFYPAGSFHVVVNPFVPPATGTEQARDHATPDSGPTLLFASRLMVEKGILDLLEAFAMLRSRRPCRLIVAGAGPAQDAVKQQIRALGVSEDVTCAGQLEHEKLMATYQAADVFVLPTYWGEGFPTAIAEAMSAGLPIVTTQLRGMADHLSEETNALFVPPRAPAALADAIERVLDNAALRARMAAANRKKVKEFAPDQAARRYLHALQQITMSKRGGGDEHGSG